MSVVTLGGCAPTPLASYLKGLAILRLVAEQKDSGARGWWADDIFQLDSRLDRTAVLDFFLREYRPTPIVAPWNGGSGFAEGDKTEALDAIRMSKEPRFEDYCRTIETVVSWRELPPSELRIGELLKRVEAVASQKKDKARDDILGVVSATREGVSPVKEALGRSPLPMRIQELEDEISALKESMKAARKGGTSLEPLRARAATVSKLSSAAKKARTILKKEHRQAGKEDLVRACRDRLGRRAVEWLDAALVIGGDDEVRYPPLLGVGGGEGPSVPG